MQEDTLTILRILADGQFHSGELLAEQLNVSRTTIWQRIGELQTQGFPIDCVRRRGYHLSKKMHFLEPGRLREQLAVDTHWCLHYEPIVTSTMDWWNQKPLRHAEVCVAELQMQGRGRQGRLWVNPFASALTFSCTWEFHAPMTTLSGLSLAVGVMVQRACQHPAIKLKWPNDLVVGKQKLGGILIELRGDMQGPCTAIIGIGLNVAFSPNEASHIDRPWCDLASLQKNTDISRNDLLVTLLRELEQGLTRFAHQGFAAFLPEWQQIDAMADKQITLEIRDERITGLVRGVDEQGQLILEQHGQLRRYASGEIAHVQNIE